MEQFLDGVPEDITRYIQDGKPKDLAEAGEIGAKWMELAESKKATVKGNDYPRGHTDHKPYNRGQPKTPHTTQVKPQTPYSSTSLVSSNSPRPTDPSDGRCFKCNELGHIKANCPKNTMRVQFITPPSHQRSPGPDASQIPLERRENLRVGGKKVTAWRDTGAQVSAIHQSFVDPKFINPKAKVTIYPFMSQAVDLPTAELPVQYKGWSGMWTFAVYDNYPIPMLLGEDLANQVRRAKRVGMVTRSQTRQASRPIPVPEPSTEAPSVLPETQTEVVDPDSMPTTEAATASPVPGPELEQQPAPASATTFSNSTPEGTSEPELAEATDSHTQKAQPEPEIPSGAPAESGSPATETTPSPTSLPEGPSPSPQSEEELVTPASREQFQAEQEADDSLQKAWAAARSTPPPLSSSNRSRDLQVCQFTVQGGDAEWPDGVYYDGKKDGGVEEVNLSTTLERLQRQQIKELCTSFAPLFSATPGRTERAYHSIDTGNAHPIRTPPYRVSPHAQAAIEREIQNMLQMGIIHSSTSAWASPVVLVPKPDGEIRFCVDYRKLNAVTRPDNYPMPRTDELLEKLGRAQFISTIDLTKGYWQVPLDEPAKERSAFVTHAGVYEFNVLPFGLRNAPATFQRLVDGLLAGLEEFAVAYLDDVAIFSDSWPEHLLHLEKVFERIRQAGLTVKAKKCQIGQNRVTYLGHQVGRGTINPLQAKVDAIQKWPVPRSKKQVQSFLGLAGYYRRFVPHYSQIAAPLTDLTKKTQPNAVKWTDECQKAFTQLKATLMSDPVLRAPDFEKPFLVTTDASERGIGAVLLQEATDHNFHPVVFLSKKLSERESHWSVSEKECYAIVYALEKLRPYVWGRRFQLQTDHAALKWLHTAKGNNKKLLRWSLALQDFDFEIQHITGASNKVADALSRESFPEFSS
ncbi:uncharacterized protein LOC127049621 [Gopherus flavomarginatus]|uniref:uncharacterized protein LOC127049621 n=1 Tax=Gopherus flavomarginatus TaxID=286002 RepID=UPI0021CBBDD1|nr:uncharacterized protein LOC127049621 [Gopherus flavomarginatus]